MVVLYRNRESVLPKKSKKLFVTSVYLRKHLCQTLENKKIKPFSYLPFLYSSIRLSKNEFRYRWLSSTKLTAKILTSTITLSGLEDETQWSENDFEGSSKASEGENKEAKQNGSDEKEMALQALNLL